jgi:TetR/AcrR family transcriptional repressor of uid operon
LKAAVSQDLDQGDRRTRILDAAQACFVRNGFHRTTMQDVAAEAGMSAGNLYRYFSSKDAMVQGLTERDRRELAEDFSAFDGGGDFMATFARLGRKHFEEDSRDRSVLCLQIWAEATRNPDFGRIAAEFEQDVTGRLTRLLEGARDAGQIAPSAQPRAIATLICTLANGLFVRRAIVPDFDPGREIPPVMNLIGALVSGAVSLTPEAACPEPV